MIVRYNPSHKAAFLELTAALHAESRYRDFRYSEKKLLKLVENPNVFCALSLRQGKAVGFLLGIAQEIWFSETKIGFDLSVYIMPKYRGGASVVRLIREFEKFCRQQRCVEINLNSSAEISTELARRLYAKLGYQECGFITRKAL